MSVRLFIDINESRMREYCRLRNDSERDNFIMDSLRDIFNRYCTAQDTSRRRASSNREYTAAASAAGSLINWTPCNSNKVKRLLVDKYGYTAIQSINAEAFLRKKNFDYESLIASLEGGFELHILLDIGSKDEFLRMISCGTQGGSKKKKKTKYKRLKKKKSKRRN